ncbi:S41 family peptidase [Catalinimonas sp. 4WD22]|uniref:S41 family peptidase n=1 Tax=Catalinimonas locisalis TaxID=3133978 RepID=UPI003100FF5C
MRTLLVIFITILLSSCQETFFSDIPEDTYENNILSLWEQFDRYYGLFPVKNIDWDSVRSAALQEIQHVQSDEELYTLMIDMLAILNDSHVGLLPIGTNLPVWQGGRAGKIDTIDDFHLDVVKAHYLQEEHFAGYFYTYGMLNHSTGYLHIEGFSDLPRHNEDALDEVISYMNKNAENIIIDIRGGYGGEDVLSQYIAGRFAKEKKPYMLSKVRNGPAHCDFTEPITWYVKPKGESQFLGEKVILTHDYTLSARETFALAMRVMPDVTFVGDTTAGGFSNQINRELPNGWGFSLSIGDWRDANGISHESIGLIPDSLVLNTREEILSGKDHALETALDILTP